MTSKSRISVIISTYNRAALLPQAIESLLNQTRIPDEIIVVDDGSTDNTPQVLAQYEHPVIAIQQENRGLAGGRNTGIRASTGDLIAFLDSDDFLAPDSIEKRATILDSDSDVDVVYSNIMMTDKEGDPLVLFTDVRPGLRPSGDVFINFAEYNLMPVHGYMVRRSCFEVTGLFKKDLAGVEDYDLWLRMAAQFRFRYLDEPLGYYRTHDQMMTVEHREQMMRCNIAVHRQVFETDAFHLLPGPRQSRIYIIHGKLHGFIGQMEEARRWFRAGIKSAPWTVRPYAFWLLACLGKPVFDRALHSYEQLRSDNSLITEFTS